VSAVLASLGAFGVVDLDGDRADDLFGFEGGEGAFEVPGAGVGGVFASGEGAAGEGVGALPGESGVAFLGVGTRSGATAASRSSVEAVRRPGV